MQHLTTELRDLIDQYSVHFLLYSAADLSLKTVSDKWSRKEIIGHLCDSVMNNLQRFIRGQYYAEPPHIIYHQEEWVALQYYQDYDAQDLINLWATLNRHICWVLDHMALENYTKIVDTSKNSMESHNLQFLATDYVAHLKHHLA